MPKYYVAAKMVHCFQGVVKAPSALAVERWLAADRVVDLQLCDLTDLDYEDIERVSSSEDAIIELDEEGMPLS